MASELAQRSDAVAAQLDGGDPCGALAEAQSLQQETIAAINEGRVPPRYQEELSSAVAALAASIACEPPPPPAPADDDDEDEKDEKEKDEKDDDKDDDEDGKGKKKGKKKNGKGKG